jgi:cell division protein FtsZ
MRVANDGIELLKKHVDSLVVIPEKLMEVLGDDVDA